MLLIAALLVGRHSGSPATDGSQPVTRNTNASPVFAKPAMPATAAPLAAAATTAPRPAANRTSSGGTSSDTTTILNAPLPPQAIDQKIIRNGSLTITAKDVVGTQGAIWNLASEFGGVVITSNTSGTSANLRADISFRVPAERFREAMDRVRGYAVKVEKEQSTAQDVTEEYVDLQARQRTLEATVLQLRTLLGKATTVDETLKVQTQLNNVQSDLERITGRINYYDTRTAFSTIAVSILPVPPAKPETVTPVARWNLTHSVQEAWNHSINGLQNVANALIVILIGGWWITFPLIVALALLLWRNRHPPLVPASGTITAKEPTDRGGQ